MSYKLAVVIPAYKVKKHILDVISKVGGEVHRIFVIDDKCPQESGKYVEQNCQDDRVEVIYNETNMGVGGSVIKGYKVALAQGYDIFIKIDGDGQMDPSLIPYFTLPIINHSADYTKGNRFYTPKSISQMPAIRRIGNIALSFLTKLSTGYWHLFDPTNGYTAIHANVCDIILRNKIAERYFFETDMLGKLSTLGAVVTDIPMDAVYEEEESSLKISNILVEFFTKHIMLLCKRIAYQYYLHDFKVGSIYLPVSIILLSYGLIFGIDKWYWSIKLHEAASAGTVMLSALPVVIGTQLFLAFLSEDINSVPKSPIFPTLASTSRRHLT